MRSSSVYAERYDAGYGKRYEVISGARLGVRREALAQEAAVLIAKWVARGLTQAVLQAIRTDVFNIAAPIAPWHGRDFCGRSPAAGLRPRGCGWLAVRSGCMLQAASRRLPKVGCQKVDAGVRLDRIAFLKPMKTQASSAARRSPQNPA